MAGAILALLLAEFQTKVMSYAKNVTPQENYRIYVGVTTNAISELHACHFQNNDYDFS